MQRTKHSGITNADKAEAEERRQAFEECLVEKKELDRNSKEKTAGSGVKLRVDIENNSNPVHQVWPHSLYILGCTGRSPGREGTDRKRKTPG